jgi:hypothetical protein
VKNEMDDRTELRLQRLSALLSELDPTEAETRASATAIRARLARPRGLPVGFKIAASIVLLLGLALAVPPARAWMLQRARGVAEALGLTSRETDSQPTPNNVAGAPQNAPVRISFAVTSDTFDFAVTPSAGQLVIRRSDRPLGSAEAQGAPDAAFTVLRGLRIEGPPASGAIYTITLPDRVAAVRLGDRILFLPATGDLKLDLADN